MTHVSTVVEPYFILLSFPLMLSVVLSSRPTTYRVFVTMLQMTLFGEIETTLGEDTKDPTTRWNSERIGRED